MQDRLAELNKTFSKDRFVRESLGAVILEAADGYAKCSMDIKPEHCNSFGIPMGGVIFTLADFAFAVAANQDGNMVVTQAAQITFLTPAAGKQLTAEAKAIREGEPTSFFRVMVTDDLGTEIAFATANGYRIQGSKASEQN